MSISIFKTAEKWMNNRKKTNTMKGKIRKLKKDLHNKPKEVGNPTPGYFSVLFFII